jgi:hypothetical protein
MSTYTEKINETRKVFASTSLYATVWFSRAMSVCPRLKQKSFSSGNFRPLLENVKILVTS